MEKEINTVRELISRNRLIEAIKEMEILANGDSFFIDLLNVSSSRMHDLQRQFDLGMISFEELDLGKNRVRSALLSCLSQILASNSYKSRQHPKNSSLPGTRKIFQNHKGSGDNVAGDKTVNY